MTTPLSFASLRTPLVVGTVSDLKTWLSVTAPGCKPACDIVELRVDSMPPILGAEHLKADRCTRPLLLTIRHASEGGSRGIPEPTRLAMALHLLPVAAAVDWEAAQLPGAGELVQAAAAAGIPLIASMHDFRATPSVDDMLRAEEAARAAGAQVVKFAFRLNRPEDIMAGVELLRRAGGPVAVMGMGPLGPTSRLMYCQLGSCLIYGYLGTTPAAPGQWSAPLCRQALRQLPAAEL